MASNETFDVILDRVKLKVKSGRDIVTQSSDTGLPVTGGRVSIAENAGTIGGLIAELSIIEPDFPIKLLDALENLGKYHGEVSQAIDNIKQLGNTKYHVYFDDAVSDKLSKEMMARLKQKRKTWYAYSGGINSMINDLLGQAALNGAISSEIVPENDLSGVKKSVIVAPKHIRFKYNKEKDEYDPYQQVSNAILGYRAESNLVPLNTTTYKYLALGRFGEKPYAIPPFISALANVAIGNDMMDNLKYVVKKLGTLGFLEVLVNGPKPKTNERDEDYFKRTQNYLNRIIPEIDKGLSRGYVAGFKDVHEFNMHSTTGNVQGAKDLVELNDSKMMTGLKQDPLMFGRNFSTTETLGRVILAKMTTQVGNYQKLVASYLEDLFLLDLQLAGYPIVSIEVEFEPAMIGDKLRDEQTRTAQLTNLTTLYKQGIIGQQTFATEAGYEKPELEEPAAVVIPIDPNKVPPADPNNPQGGGGTDPNADGGDATDPKTTASNSKQAAVQLGKLYAEYPYHSEDCGCTIHSLDKSEDKKIQDYVDAYYKSTKGVYSKAVKKSTAAVGKALASLGEGATEQVVLDNVIYNLYKDWGKNFSKPQQKVIADFVHTAYTFFRQDKSIFGAGKDKMPNGALNLVDMRTIQYYKDSDALYLGKFITDEDLKKKITGFIKEKYVTNELPIGNNKQSLDAFKNEFGDLMDGQDWKLTRIISTTVNKMRNTAAVAYMNQAEVTQYEVTGVSDRLQCGFCREMQGKTFSVSKAVDHLSNLSNSDPALVGSDSPFVNSVFKKSDEIKDISGEDLQSYGIHFPPYHVLCRDTVIAVI